MIHNIASDAKVDYDANTLAEAKTPMASTDVNLKSIVDLRPYRRIWS
jgi:hypothetical protein